MHRNAGFNTFHCRVPLRGDFCNWRFRLPRMHWALWQNDNNRAAKLHLNSADARLAPHHRQVEGDPPDLRKFHRLEISPYVAVVEPLFSKVKTHQVGVEIGRWPGRASDAYFEGVFQISVDIDPKMGKLGG